MKTIKLAKAIIQFNFLYWVIYNSYFGWNLYPMSDAEKICDQILHYVFLVAICMYLMPVARLYELAIKKYEEQ